VPAPLAQLHSAGGLGAHTSRYQLAGHQATRKGELCGEDQQWFAGKVLAQAFPDLSRAQIISRAQIQYMFGFSKRSSCSWQQQNPELTQSRPSDLSASHNSQGAARAFEDESGQGTFLLPGVPTDLRGQEPAEPLAGSRTCWACFHSATPWPGQHTVPQGAKGQSFLLAPQGGGSPAVSLAREKQVNY
jgi:hypothetical protein